MPTRPADPNLRPLLVYIDAKVRQKLRIKAATEETTVAEIVRRLLAAEVFGVKIR